MEKSNAEIQDELATLEAERAENEQNLAVAKKRCDVLHNQLVDYINTLKAKASLSNDLLGALKDCVRSMEAQPMPNSFLGTLDLANALKAIAKAEKTK